MFYTNVRACRSQHINCLKKLYSKFSKHFLKTLFGVCVISFLLLFLLFFDNCFLLPAAENSPLGAIGAGRETR